MFALTLAASFAELALWSAAGEPNEWAPVAAASLACAALAALVAAGWGALFPPGPAYVLGLAPVLVPFLHGVAETQGLDGGEAWLVGAPAALVLAGWLRQRAPTPRGILLAGALAAGLAAASWMQERAARPEPAGRAAGASRPGPDVVLLVMDTTRRDRLSVYGYPAPTTPRIAEHAARAEVYEAAWSVSPWTPPSHATMLTGLLPAEHGVDGFGTSPPLPADVATLPGVLRAAGYRTAGFPANLILSAPGWSRDFDVYLPHRFVHRHTLVPLLDYLFVGATPAEREDRSSARVFGRARDWWEANEGEARFLFLNLMDAHRTYRPLDEDFARFLPGVDREWALSLEERWSASQVTHDFTPEEVEVLSTLYDAEIAGMDRQVGGFLDWLAARGELDDTIVVITSDHGERLGERSSFGHKLIQDPYVLEVPLIVRYPAAREAARIGRRVQLDGLPGYVLHLAGLAAPPAMERNALHLQDRGLVVAQLQHPAALLADMQRDDPAFDPEPYRGDWAFVGDEDGFCLEWRRDGDGGDGRLTDFVRDPDFRREVSADHPQRLERLRAAAEALPAYTTAPAVRPDPEMLEILHALGYTG